MSIVYYACFSKIFLLVNCIFSSLYVHADTKMGLTYRGNLRNSLSGIYCKLNFFYFQITLS